MMTDVMKDDIDALGERIHDVNAKCDSVEKTAFTAQDMAYGAQDIAYKAQEMAYQLADKVEDLASMMAEKADVEALRYVDIEAETLAQLPVQNVYGIYYYLLSDEWQSAEELDMSGIAISGVSVYWEDISVGFLSEEDMLPENGEVALQECVTIEKIRISKQGERHPRFGKHCSIETKQKMSVSARKPKEKHKGRLSINNSS